MGYTAFVLSDDDRNRIRKEFEPTFPDFIGHHVTWEFGVPEGTDIPDVKNLRFVLDYMSVDEIKGVEVFHVVVWDRTQNKVLDRPDGKLPHLTWSIDRSLGAKPVDSNDVIRRGPITNTNVDIEIFPTAMWLK